MSGKSRPNILCQAGSAGVIGAVIYQAVWDLQHGGRRWRLMLGCTLRGQSTGTI